MMMMMVMVVVVLVEGVGGGCNGDNDFAPFKKGFRLKLRTSLIEVKFSKMNL